MRLTAARRRERGAVAIIVSITVVAVLIPTSALAVDLGNVYVRTASLQRAADEAARSGAVALARQQNAGVSGTAAMDAARSAVVDLLCHDPSLNPDTDGDGTGDGPWQAACSTGDAWAKDNDLANGEVQFYAGAPSAQHTYDTTRQIADGTSLVSGIRVLTPPSRVQYGLASAIPGQAPYADPQRSATATLRTVLPKFGILPLWSTTTAHVLCARDAPKPLVETPVPGAACTSSRFSQSMITRGYLSGPGPLAIPVPGQAVSLASPSAVNDLRTALINGASSSPPGRLTSTSCPNPKPFGTVNGSVEGQYLSDFVNPRFGTVADLRAEIGATTTVVAKPGLLSSGILRCGRLAIVTALSGSSAGGLPAAPPQVAGWRLLWIDSQLGDGTSIASGSCVQRGLVWASTSTRRFRSSNCSAPSTTSKLTAITGYLLDPGLLPAVVSGLDAANSVDYLAGDLPATVRLIRDAADPPPR